MPDTQTVLMPTGAQQTGSIPIAPRPKSLRRLRVALLDNGKEFSDIVLDGLAQALARDFEVTDIKFWRKGFPAKGAPFIAEMAAEIRCGYLGCRPLRLIFAVERHRRGQPGKGRRARCGADQPVILSAGADCRPRCRTHGPADRHAAAPDR